MARTILEEEPVTDEEVLRIAQGLTRGEWWGLRAETQYWCRDRDAGLIQKGLVVLWGMHFIDRTPLGTKVWAWNELFWVDAGRHHRV